MNDEAQKKFMSERRLYFPTYNQTFPLWIRNEIICEEFLRLFATNGKSVTLLAKPKSEDIVNVEKGIRGVRFDTVAKTGTSEDAQDFHIYCIDSQREFERESYVDRELYYACVAMATKSLKTNEDFSMLRPVTVIFIYIDNSASTNPIDLVNLYRRRDIEIHSVAVQPYTAKFNFININLNNKANWEAGQLSADVRAFMDIMSIGDDEYLVTDSRGSRFIKLYL